MSRGVIDGKRARRYDEKCTMDKKGRQYDKLILEMAGRDRKARVCDLCCGPGNVAEILLGNVASVTGIDASPEMIRICNEKFGRRKDAKFLVRPAGDTGLAAGSFGWVVVSMGLHHIKDKEAVVSEISRMLRKGGKVLVIDKCCENRVLCFLVEFSMLLRGSRRIFDHFLDSYDGNLSLFKGFETLEHRRLTKNRVINDFILVARKK